MKKKLAIFLAVALVISALSGCRSNTEPTTDIPATTEAAKSTEAQGQEATEGAQELTKEKITLKVWHIAIDEKRHSTVTNAIARFTAKYPNIEVIEVANENDPYKTKLATTMASGEEPDIFVSWGGGWLGSFVDEGKVLNIDSRIEEISDEYYESALSLFEVDGKRFALPYSCGPAPVFYNKQIYADLGLEVPKTLKEFEANCEAIKKAGIIPIALGNASQWPGALTFISLSLKYGGSETFLNAYNRVNGGTFEDESFVKAGNKIQEWIGKGFYNDGFNGTNYDTGGSRMLFYSGMAAHIVQTNGMFANCKSEAEDFYNNNLGFFNYPSVEDGKGSTTEILGGGNAYSIAASTKYPDEAFALIHALTDKEFGQDSVDIAGMLSGVKGVTITNPLTQEVQDLISNATYIQNFYDQFLPAELGALHKQTTYDIFGGTKTPEQAAAEMEAKAKEILDK